MAMCSLRARRAIGSISALRRSLAGFVPAVSAAPAPVPFLQQTSPSVPFSHPAQPQSRAFRSSPASLLAKWNNSRNFDDGDKLDPDTILFEGCDYKHWLITMDFPKDPKPTPEEMVRTYEETCAKGLNISLEEAKRRMYACSTTTYQGFQAEMTEAESEQFRGIPGVVFILPDSYIDPQNKEYGGDKYENGVITHRPPPIQYGRQRPRDRNRDYNSPRYDQEGGSMRARQPNPQYSYPQGNMQAGDGRNYGPPQNYPPQQNYVSPGQGDGRIPRPMNNMDYAPSGREQAVSPQGDNNRWGQQNNYFGQELRDMPQGDRRNYAPPQNDFRGNNMNRVPNTTPVGPFGPGGQEQRDMLQGDRRNHAPPQNDFRGSNMNYVSNTTPVGPFGAGGQGDGGYPRQGMQGGLHGQGMDGGYRQGSDPNYGQGYRGQGEDQRFPLGDHERNMPGDFGGRNQGRY